MPSRVFLILFFFSASALAAPFPKEPLEKTIFQLSYQFQKMAAAIAEFSYDNCAMPASLEALVEDGYLFSPSEVLGGQWSVGRLSEGATEQAYTCLVSDASERSVLLAQGLVNRHEGLVMGSSCPLVESEAPSSSVALTWWVEVANYPADCHLAAPFVE